MMQRTRPPFKHLLPHWNAFANRRSILTSARFRGDPRSRPFFRIALGVGLIYGTFASLTDYYTTNARIRSLIVSSIKAGRKVLPENNPDKHEMGAADILDEQRREPPSLRLLEERVSHNTLASSMNTLLPSLLAVAHPGGIIISMVSWGTFIP
ncbi:hypothetical protein FRC02_009099 [Tulasnella sp. 418]|nr:hypothetical protein FRC02_009099 [Tulasnella sp. 418]